MDERTIRRNLRVWYRKNARDLPWRRTGDPYAITVSEFMLQQTQVSTVVPYFVRWMRRFPDVGSLAAADETEVLAHWQGLGYYSRARNLHRMARSVAGSNGGVFPEDPRALRELPGVGEYTAAAIAAFAFDRAAPVVDANIARVLARLHGYRKPVDSAAGKRFLSAASAALQPARSGARELNSALMELGALVCRPKYPACPACPIRGECAAARAGVDGIPAKRPRPKTTRVAEMRALVTDGESIWLKRQERGRWAGLWVLPEIVADLPAGAPFASSKIACVEEYSVTRYRVRMEVILASPGAMASLAGLEPFTRKALDDVPIASPHRRAINRLSERDD